MIEKIDFLSDPKEIQKLYDFIKNYPLDYPDYSVWLEKCKRQLEIGDKKAFYTSKNGSITGSVVFQKDREEDSVLEIKNFRVAEEYSGKGIGSTLESMLCSYGKLNRFKRIRADTHYNNFPMIQFLIKRGYNLEGQENLYLPDKPEVILAKDL